MNCVALAGVAVFKAKPALCDGVPLECDRGPLPGVREEEECDGQRRKEAVRNKRRHPAKNVSSTLLLCDRDELCSGSIGLSLETAF